MTRQVSVVVVNWNGRPLLEACLASLAAQSLRDLEVILVDNASSDDSVAWTRRAHPEVRVVALERNAGFAGGSNRGIEAASGELIALLNNDALAQPAWAERLLEAARDPRVGIVASRVVLDSDRARLDSAGDGMTTVGVAYKRGHRGPAGGYGAAAEVFGASGCAMLLRRAMLGEIGLFDEDFFLIYEDADLAFRARLRGWRAVYAPEAVVYHKLSASIGSLSATAVYYGQRNAEYVYFKNMPAPLVWRYLPAHLANAFVAGGYFLAKGRFGDYLRGKVDFLRDIGKIAAKRRSIQRARTAAASEIDRMLERRWLAVRRAGK